MRTSSTYKPENMYALMHYKNNKYAIKQFII